MKNYKPECYQEYRPLDLTSQTKIVRINNKRYRLPKVLYFDDGNETLRFNARFYDVVEFRAPKKGEWFLSGALVTAYLATNDLSTEYLIAKPTHKVIKTQTTRYEKGDKV